MGRYKSRELLHFGVDYLKGEIFGGVGYFAPLSKNTNFIQRKKEGVFFEKMEGAKKYDMYIRCGDQKTGITLFFLLLNYEEKKYGSVEIKNKVEITGQGFIFH